MLFPTQFSILQIFLNKMFDIFAQFSDSKWLDKV